LTATRKTRHPPVAAVGVCFFTLVLVVGCGGGRSCPEPPVTCSTDPTGTFTADAVCGLWPIGCDQASHSASTRSATGTLTLNGDGSAGLDMDLDFTYSTTVPASCGLNCDEVDDLIGLCDQDGDDCVCEGEAGIGSGRSFTWRLEGNQVILDFGEPGETGTLCVSGDIARSHFPDGLEMSWVRKLNQD
jgi:hypothetical protein